MNYEQLKAEIKQYAAEIGIDDIGFANAERFSTLKERLVKHRDKGYESGFEEPDLDKRTEPEKNLPEASSIIAIALAYPSKLENPPRSEPGAYRGMLSRSAWGMDYHIVLKDRLHKLEQFILSKVPEAKMMSMVDTGALSDRAVAERAGIGYTGKNCAIISPTFGSWIYLGEMITNLPLPPDEPLADDCGDCTRCIDACPTGAIVGPGQLNAQRCISFLTQTKGFLNDDEKKALGNRLYGCDTCQVVCPKNKGFNWTHQTEFQPDPETVKPLLKSLLSIGKREFKERFGRSSAAWRGKKPIQRNAVVALGHFKDHTAIPDLTEVLHHDPRPELRESAAWSLGQIGGHESVQALEVAKNEEKHEKVLSQIDKTLHSLYSSASIGSSNL